MPHTDVVINIRGEQAEDGELGTTELCIPGKLFFSDDAYILEYEESEPSMLGKTTIKLSKDKDRVELKRSGAVRTEFVFVAQRAFAAAYETPFGLLQMSLLPTRVVSEVEGDRGAVNLEYVLCIGDRQTVNRLSINYKNLQ